MGTIKSLASLIIGLAISITITLYFNLNVIWAGINGFVTMMVVLWIEKKIRQYRAEIAWQKYIRDNR